jgi:hypothetical protein
LSEYEEKSSQTARRLTDSLRTKMEQLLINVDVKEEEKLIEELRCFKEGIEYKPKDISRPKKLTPEEKKKLKEESKVNEKEDLKKKLKEKFGRREV